MKEGIRCPFQQQFNQLCFASANKNSLLQKRVEDLRFEGPTHIKTDHHSR